MYTNLQKLKKRCNGLKLLALVAILGFAGSASAQLSGSYTVDNTLPNSGGNFSSFNKFRDSIVLVGVTGAVNLKFNTNQTELTQVVFPPIAGVSAKFPVTIDGNGKFFSVAVAGSAIFMNGADFFTYTNLTVRNTQSGQYKMGFRFDNSSDNNTISKCTIEFTDHTTGYTTGSAYIAFTSSSTSMVATTSSYNYGINNTISGNTMFTSGSNSPGPTYGIAYSGNTSTYSSTAQDNTFTGNIIQNFYYMGIIVNYSNGVQVLNNDISRKNATSANCYTNLYGINCQNSYATNRSTKLDGNNMHDWPYAGASASVGNSLTYGVYSYNNYGTSLTKNRVSISGNTIKNVFAKDQMYLGSINYTYNVDINSNICDNDKISVQSSNGSYNFWGWYLTGISGYQVNGNTIQNCEGGYMFFGIYNYQQSNVSNYTTSISNNVIQNNLNSYYVMMSIGSVYMYGNNTSFVNINDNIIIGNTCSYYYNIAIGTYNPYYGYIGYGYINVQRNTIMNNRNTGSVGYTYGVYSYYDYDMNITDNLITENNGYYGSYGIQIQSYNSGAYTCNVRQNTVKSTWNGGYTYHQHMPLYVYAYYHSKVNVIGNLVDVKGGYYAYPAYTYNTTPSNITWNLNSYFVNSVTNVYYYNPNGNYGTFAAWASSGFPGTGEKYGDPKWNNAGAGDFRSNVLMNQNNVPYNALDFKDAKGVLRNTSKNDRGAVENMLDIAQTGNTFAPSGLICAGYSASPTLTLKNNFIDTVTGFSVGVSVNGVLKGTKLVTTKIVSGASGTVTFDPIVFSIAGVNKVKFFLLDADDLPSNDTTTYTFTVTAAPGGSVISQKAGSQGFYDYQGKGYSVNAYDETLVMEVSSPRKYTDAQYGLNPGWSVNAYVKDGVTTLPGSAFVFTAPAGGNKAYATFKAPAGYTNKTLKVFIQVIDNASGCDTIFTRNLIVAPKGDPKYNIPAITCDGSSLYFENLSQVSSGQLLYTWDFGDGSPTEDATSPSHKYPTYGTYTVKLSTITTPYGFKRDTTFKVFINEIPTANFARVNACEGLPVKFTNTSTIGSGVLTYEWNFGDGSPLSTVANPTRTYVVPNGYAVTLKVSANGCTSSVTKNVYEFAKPKPSFTFSSPNNCDNEVFSFNNTSTISQGAFGNLWNFNDAGNISTDENPGYDFITAGTKTVRLKTISEYGCTDSTTRVVTVKNASRSDFANSPACSLDPTVFTNTSFVPAGTIANYTWNFGDGTPVSSTPNPSHAWAVPGTKTVTLKTVLDNGCKDQITKTLNVGVQPNVDFIAEDQCAGQDVLFQNGTTWAQGDISYTWDFGNGDQAGISDPIYKYTTSASQTYNVKLKATIAGGCSDSLIKTITINAAPTTCDFDIVYDGTAGHRNYKLVPKGGSTSGINYTWLTGDGTTNNSVSAGTTYDYKQDGKYIVKMTARNANGCECSSSKAINIAWTDVKDINGLDKSVSVYPNPNTGKFTISVDGDVNTVKVNVYNLLGEIVKTEVSSVNTIDMDLSGFANGIYLVKIYNGTNVVTKKVTINR